MLKYRGVTLHDSNCACCASTQTVTDAAKLSLDPTGTGSIRRAMKADMQLKWRSLRAILRRMLIENDYLGLSPYSINNPMQAGAMTAGGASKVQAFQVWFDNVLKNQILQGDGSYLRGYMSRAYAKGAAFGETQLGLTGTPGLYRQQDVIDTLHALTVVELQGVMEAVSQQVVRTVTNNILSKTPGRRMLRSIMRVVHTIGGNRTNAIAEFMVVKAFNEAALDAYEAAGVADVGLVPELRPQPLTTDAKAKIKAVKKPKRPKVTKPKKMTAKQRARTGAGSRISRKRAPSSSTVRRIRQAQEKLEKLKIVNVRTAGDNDVCIICEDIAEDGPYTINRARSLIPAHPNAVLEGSTFAPYGELQEMVRSRFDGPAVELRAGPEVLTIGPNHPMLTRRGWKLAHSIEEGDELLHDKRVQRPARVGVSDFKQMPLLEDVFVALADVCGSSSASSGHDFHGDVGSCYGEIKIVNPARGLLEVLDPGVIQHLGKDDFLRPDVRAALKACLGSLVAFGKRGLSASSGFVRSADLLRTLLAGHARPLDGLLLGLASGRSEFSLDPAGEYGAANAVLAREAVYRFASGVLPEYAWRDWSTAQAVGTFTFEKVTAARHVQFSGWAFDASTESGLYNNGGFVVKNCRCTFVPVRDRRFARSNDSIEYQVM